MDVLQIVPAEMDNYKSATCVKARDIVEAQIREESDNNRYVIAPRVPVLLSAIGAVPQKASSKLRIIHDCSRPYGSALNDFAYNSHFKYSTIQDAVTAIKPGSFMAKVDLSSAYRSVRIHPSSYAETGLKWTFSGDRDPTVLVDTRLPFGTKRSPEIFNDLSQAICHIMASKGFKHVVAYLDDFIVVADSYEECFMALHTLLALLRLLGFAINYRKVVCPATRLVFLGIVLDSVKLVLELPKDKLTQLYNSILAMSKKIKITKRELQSLIGKLSRATQCVYGGQPHLRRLIDRLSGSHGPWHKSRITSEMRADLICICRLYYVAVRTIVLSRHGSNLARPVIIHDIIHGLIYLAWWCNFMEVFNGTTPMIDNRPGTAISTDACNIAAGCVYGNSWIYTPWTSWSGSSQLHINHKEVLAVEPAVAAWAPLWTDKRVYVLIDNQAAVAIINKGSSNNCFVMSSL